jgi:general secretion pathway protein H
MSWCRRSVPAGNRKYHGPVISPGGGWPAGFTLIETIVVLTVLGLILTVVVGFLPRRNTTLELDNATSLVAGAMRMARSRAISESRFVPFAVTQDGHGFQMDNGLINLGPTVWIATPDRRAILFGPDGSASGGALRVQAAKKERLILIDLLTGRITIADAS